MGRPRKQKEEAQPQNEVAEVKANDTTEQEATKDEKKEPLKSVFDTEFLGILTNVAIEMLKAAEEVELEMARKVAESKWYNRRKRHKDLQKATRVKLEAAGTVYYLVKNIESKNK